MDYLARLPCQLLQRRSPRVLVLHRHERHLHADHTSDPGPPHPRAAHDELGLDAAPIRLDGPHATILDLDIRDFGLAVELRAALPGQPGHRLARPDGLGDAVCRNVEAAPDPVRIQNRHLLHTLLRRNELGFEPPRGREPVLALEIVPPLPALAGLSTPPPPPPPPPLPLPPHAA